MEEEKGLEKLKESDKGQHSEAYIMGQLGETVKGGEKRPKPKYYHKKKEEKNIYNSEIVNKIS